ncbi:thiaminase II [Staphylococcus americanisciuri]|uniref:Aminopyrimidine aminohydrolase n=1 Tax=Staphylococcus americanisciuri TaxID=2973940 RepID=A0ABT2F0X5_9STAP|nr:thiaminase II [Staphylococcus americanisciuri]MCS4486093.1 thiaminase II [Staphylococcus americanisciuri]
MTFSERLFRRVEPIWQSYLEHPFVQGIGDGTLDKDKFKHWMKQDYLYLIDYTRLFALGVVKAHDLETMGLFGTLVHETLQTEMQLHRDYAAQFGISEQELTMTEPASTTTSYTSYMLDHAQRGGIEYVVAAVLTCTWSYNFIGRALNEIEGAAAHLFYGEWVRMYSSDEFSALTNQLIEMMNTVTAGKNEVELQALEDIVVRTSYYEYMFWDMAEHKEMWSIPVGEGR